MKKVLTLVLSLALLFAIIYSPDRMDKGLDANLEVHFIDVGQGDSILVRSDGQYMLIDGGKKSQSETVLNYLNEQGVKDIKYVVGTHPHEDHIGGLVAVLDNFEVENIMLPNVISNTRIFEDLLDVIDKNGLKIKKPNPLDTFNIGKSKVTILGPNSEKYSLTNDYSIVLKLENGKNSFIFTGDAEKKAEMEVVEAHKSILKVDVLKTGHHGSKTSTNGGFLDAVSPKYAIISVAEDNIYDHPDSEVLKRLEEREVKIFRTDLDGNIVVKSDGKNIMVDKKDISLNFDKIYVNLDEKFKDIKENLLIKYLTVKINLEEM